MAKPHGSVRIGPISLFALIIILCLAVLAVLSVTTARAELSTTERQAATTMETYQLESVAQQFVAEVDAVLATEGRAGLEAMLPGYGVAVEAGATEEIAGTDPVGASSRSPSDEGVAAVEADDQEAAPTEDATGEVIDDEGAATETIADETPAGEAIADDGASDGEAVVTLDGSGPITESGTFDGTLLSITFSMESGRTLAVVLRINDNDTYTIEQWKTTTQWTDDGTGANLWLGER